MTSPQAPEAADAVRTPCVHPGCGRPPVADHDRCLLHLTDGEASPASGDEASQIARAQIADVTDRLVRALVDDLPQHVIDERTGSVTLHAVVTARKVPGWRSMERDLRILAARLLEEPPFQATSVQRAKPLLDDQVLNVLEVRVPAATPGSITLPLRSVVDDLVSWSLPAAALTGLDVVVAGQARSWSSDPTGPEERAERARRHRPRSGLEDAERDRRRILQWCDGATTGRVVAEGPGGSPAAWVSVAEMPEHRAASRNEDARRLAMIGVARIAARIAELDDGARPIRVIREGARDVPLASCAGDRYAGWDWRFDPDRGASPVTDDVRRWWEANRGPLSVRCSLHGELARVDATTSIAMLAPAWDAAVVEYHDRWERSWVLSTDDPECEERCEVRVEPTFHPGGPNLLDVEQMWIVLEGAGRPWWAYDLSPDDAR